jgi:hypothetical protein
MSEIPYVNELGVALDAMTTAPRPGLGGSLRHRLVPRIPRGRSRLLAGVAVVLIGGGAAAAATVLSAQTPTVIAARGPACIFGSPGHYKAAAFDVEEGPGTPAQACAPVVHRPASKLIACYSKKYGISVYYRDGSPTECAAAGMGPLPAGLAAASKRVATLVHDLNRLQASRNCFSVAALTAGTDATLRRLAFAGWRATTQRNPRLANLAGWHCAQYPASGARYSDAGAAVSTNDNSGPGTVAITTGPTRHQDFALQALNRSNLMQQTGTRCFSIGSLQTAVRSAVRASFGAGTQSTFAARAEPRNTQMGVGRQPRYQAGCATLVAAELIAGRGIETLIWQKGWPAMAPGGSLPNSAYAPTLPAKP